MRISGEWRLCDDGVRRPLIDAEVLAGNGHWLPIEFLVDCGADRTVLAATALRLLGSPTIASVDALGGLGRDITNLFAAIIDHPGATVCLLGQKHRYQIVQSGG